MGGPSGSVGRPQLLCCAVLLFVHTSDAVDHGMKLQQMVGSVRAVRALLKLTCAGAASQPISVLCVTLAVWCVRAQAEESKNYDTALSKLDALVIQAGEWRAAIEAAKAEAETPAEPVAAPEPPAESIEFEMNSTHVPERCPRKSEDGAIMKVHYVGKLISTGKIFASSFHTGSQPLRFVLGSDEVLAAWNQGLGGMCEGERRRLRVPWDMAFGAEGSKGVPPYSDVQYDFELVEMSLPRLSAQNLRAKEEEAAATGKKKKKKKKKAKDEV